MQAKALDRLSFHLKEQLLNIILVHVLKYIQPSRNHNLTRGFLSLSSVNLTEANLTKRHVRVGNVFKQYIFLVKTVNSKFKIYFFYFFNS